MSFHKKVKFPFEVTKGKARDLFKLRFIRKSELEPSVQHAMRHNVNLMGKQLDSWFKEQSYTIGSISKEQDKVQQCRRRLRKELRRIKKAEYARRQEDIRDRLERIRRNMLAMKVVQKFKENIRISREERLKIVAPVITGESKVSETDLLKSGNSPNMYDGAVTIDTAKQGTDTSSYEREVRAKESMKQAVLPESHSIVQSWREAAADFRDTHSDSSSEGERDDEMSERSGNYGDERRPSLQRYPSSHGPRMETIPEESDEEVLVEIEDSRVQKTRLTKRSLHLLNRSQSRKNIFETPGGVPLLPDIPKQSRAQQTRSVADSFDKETQTSFESRSRHSKKKKKKRQEEDQSTKHVVVNMPSSGHSIHNSEAISASDDPRSLNKNGTHRSPKGSTESHSYDGDAEWENNSNESDNVFLLETPGKAAKQSEFQAPFPGPSDADGFPLIPTELIAADLGVLHRFYEQNPFSTQFRERSFYLKSPIADTRPGSADTCGSRERRRENTGLGASQPEMTQVRTLTLDDIKGKRLEDIRREMNKHCAQINLRATPTMLVLGKRSKELQRENTTTPPNSPSLGHSSARVKDIQATRPSDHLSMVLQAQRRGREQQWRNIHDAVSREPVQQYERTKSGRLLPFGSPRVAHHEIPSMKDKYHRDKLLKAERGTILGQTIKMKRFMNRLSNDPNLIRLPPITGNPPGSATSRSTNAPKKSLSNLFKVHQSDAPKTPIETKKIMNRNTIPILKQCRYLREYIPMSEEERLTSFTERETSWKSSHPPYDVNYIASIQLQQAAYCSL